MRGVNFIIYLLFTLDCLAQPADIWFTTDPTTNWSNVVQIWRGVGSSFYEGSKCQDFIFDAVESVGRENKGQFNRKPKNIFSRYAVYL